MRHEEQGIQVAVVQWMRLQFPKILFTISPGGLLTSGRTGSKAKKLGYTAGTPDLLIFYPTIFYKGLFIELKTKSGTVSPDQKRWITELNKLGYKAVVCFGYDEAVEQIKNYLSK